MATKRLDVRLLNGPPLNEPLIGNGIVKFTVPGAPRQKKNTGRIIFHGHKCKLCNRGRYPSLLPAKGWSQWVEDAARSRQRWKPKCELPIRHQVNAEAVFYRDTLRKVDACNLYEGLADVLERCGIVEDDTLIVSWHGSELDLDRENPRVEVTLTER